MRTRIIATITIALLPLCALGQEGWEVEWSGFFSSYYDSDEESFTLGPVELDFFAELHPRFLVNGAFVGEYDVAENSADVGVGTAWLDIFFQDYVDDPADRPVVANSGLALGLFDVPFGIDYLLYADPDRWNISTPITADCMFDGGWTDVGAMLYTSLWITELRVYGVNGYTSTRPAAGASLDILPTEWAMLGGSYAMSSYEEGDGEWTRAGGHLKVALYGAELSGEYVMGTDAEVPVVPTEPMTQLDHAGYYGQLNFDFTEYVFPFYVGGRYGLWQPDFDFNGDGQTGNDDITRITGYAGVRIIDPVTFKAEYQTNDWEMVEGGGAPPPYLDQEEEGFGFPEEVLWAGVVVSF